MIHARFASSAKSGGVFARLLEDLEGSPDGVIDLGELTFADDRPHSLLERVVRLRAPARRREERTQLTTG
ncbi:MAG: hypothetical protein NXI30_16080 [bacterium]|nr:hypothetical protein [bacterium]